MSPRQIVFANALAAAIAAAVYSVALVLFAIVDSSDFDRIDRPGLQFALAYFVLYFIYFGLYLGFVIALTKQAAVPIRLALGIAAAFAVIPLGWSAFLLGYALGALLFLMPGMLFTMSGGWSAALLIALLAVPATGFAVGYAFNVMIALFANWQKSAPELTEIRRRNIAAATLSACIAAYLAFAHGMGHGPALGLARVIEQIAVGMIGPLIHVVSAVTLAFKAPADEIRVPLGQRATRAALVMAACMLVVLSAAAWIAHVRSGYQLWTATGLLRTLATPAAIQERRRPAHDQPIRIADYVVEARPGDLKANSYDWKTERFLHAKFKLGTVEATGGPVEVMLDLTKAWQSGLGYICDEPVDGVLSPCQVVHRKDNAQRDKNLQDDPRVIRVGLYQGQSEIGRVDRTFLISCRYSTRICKLEFVQPWYEDLRVALIFARDKREHWAEIVRFAIPEIERIVQRAR